MKKIFVHVGAPKTGTSQIQDLLAVNSASLRANGVLYPRDSFDQHFLAGLDLLGKSWGGVEKRARGGWRDLVERANAWDGTVVISSEVLAGATAEQASRALLDLDGEVHVIYSARDLARQIPSEWQESIKHRRTHTYAAFCADLMRDRPRMQACKWFWSVQCWQDVLHRWGSTLPPERVHVLTVPPASAPGSLLIERFLGLVGIEPSWLPSPSDRANPSLGVAEAAVIRTINKRLPPRRLDERVYREYVFKRLVHRRLARSGGGRSIVLPPSMAGWVDATSKEWVAALSHREYDVVGDLSELLPRPAVEDWHDPDQASPKEQLDVAYDVIEALLLEVARLESQSHAVHRVTGASIRTRIREKAISLSAKNRLAERAIVAYRRRRR